MEPNLPPSPDYNIDVGEDKATVGPDGLWRFGGVSQHAPTPELTEKLSK